MYTIIDKNAPEFFISQPRESVEIHLPDKRVLCGPRSRPVGEFLRLIAHETEIPIVGAIVNSELRELTFPIHIDSQVLPVSMADPDGARIYRRSLIFLLETAFTEMFKGVSLNIDHSVASGGYYCQVSGRLPLTVRELKVLEKRMFELVSDDLPFTREEVPLQEAINHFKSQGSEDKVELLKHRQKDYLTLYSLSNHRDYHHGYMVPSTGYLNWFGLKKTDGGFTLRFPRRNNPTAITPLPKYPKLLNAFRRYGDWLQKLGISSVGALNASIKSGRIQEIILISEAFHDLHVTEIASQIASSYKKNKVVLIAGPTSSGKTTFSKRLSIALLARGISPFPIELDNYFLNRDQTPKDKYGNYDFESFKTLDINLLMFDLNRLSVGEEVQLPKFNFRTGSREPGEIVRLSSGEILLLEGIHGLNPNLLPDYDNEKVFRIYVSALTQLNLDRHNRVSTTDTRLIRRITRDYRHRGYNALKTIRQWESVRRGEKINIFPYQENSDVMFNSALVYDLSALKPFVEPLLLQVPFGTPEFIEAKRLLSLLEWFLPIDTNHIPDNSILREFIGDSILSTLTLWDHHRQ
jgi:uridine kinase